MKLKKLYSLRTDFTIIGLTGRVGSGCSEIAKWLSADSFNKDFKNSVHDNSTEAEEIKYRICVDYLSYGANWKKFHIINYKDVLLLHLFHEGINEGGKDLDNSVEKIIEIIFQNGNSINNEYTNRFDLSEDVTLKDDIIKFLKNDTSWFEQIRQLDSNDLHQFLKDNKHDTNIFNLYFTFFEDFSKTFYSLLNNHNITKRTRLMHDLANNLRDFKTVRTLNPQEMDRSLEHIYTVAETINKLIKVWKAEQDKHQRGTKIVIDSLKNSLELMYFKEKYSAFYMVATNKSEEERCQYVRQQVENNYKELPEEDKKKHSDEILLLDESEYDGGDFNKGEFSSPDTENCIQKSDYHIYFSNLQKGTKEAENPESNYEILSLNRQLIKLIALIHQPGIITPTGIERCMQVAYNAKFNSGCISRQVGAVVTDSFFGVKSIGWNDVAQHQMPCNLRSVSDLILGNQSSLFSDYEKDGGAFIDENGIQKKFKQLLSEDYINLPNVKDNLEGKNCSFCFKTVQNTYEKEKNQVHTRSLHAEENAMMQITKNGGNGLKEGNLFTTASPCELCSKKAYQLGIKKIFYIDPYPGIATKHTLKNGVDEKYNPKLIMFQGAVGRAFHKLYEPFLSYKDELKILTDISPKSRFSESDYNVIKKKMEENPELLERLNKDLSTEKNEEK